MIHERDRYIQFFRLRIGSKPAEKRLIPLAEVMGQVSQLVDSGQASWQQKKGTQSVRILQMESDNPDYFVLLISISKSDLADPAFEHMPTGDSRTELKRDGEGVSFSAHMLIYKEPSQSDPGGAYYHKVALEKIAGLGGSVCRPFLSHIFKMSYSLNPMEFSVAGTRKRYYPTADLSGDLGTTLQEEIGKGKITLVELIDHRNDESSLDETGVFHEHRATLQLKVVGEHDENKILRVVNELKRRARGQNFDEVKIRVKRDDTGEQTIPVNIDIVADATETLAVRKELVSLQGDRFLGQRHSAIREDLVQLIHDIE